MTYNEYKDKINVLFLEQYSISLLDLKIGLAKNGLAVLANKQKGRLMYNYKKNVTPQEVVDDTAKKIGLISKHRLCMVPP